MIVHDKLGVHKQILIYMFVELYKHNDTGLTKQNILEKRNDNCTKKNENKHQGFSIFYIILDHVLPICIACACDVSYMCYINKCLIHIYR